MKQILILALIFTSLTAEAKKKKKHVASTSTKSTLFEVKDDQSVILRSSDVSDASVTTAGKEKDAHSALFIELKPAAAKRFSEYTKKHIGKTLSVMIDGKVIASPKIMDEIEGGHLAIDPNLPSEEVEALADRISHSVSRAN